MRIVMIHALPESIPPVKLAFQDIFPEAQVINLFDEGLFIDFEERLTPNLRRRMTQLICYAEEHGADAIGLACSVFAPVVETARELVNVPVLSPYDSVMAEAVENGPRVGIISSVLATLRDSEHYLLKAAKEKGVSIQSKLCLAEDLVHVLRTDGEAGFSRRIAEKVAKLEPKVDSVLLSQFSMAAALSHVSSVANVPILSAPHCSALAFKKLLSSSVTV